jgi:hypothetical protein
MMKKLHVLCLWQWDEGKDSVKYVVQGDKNVSVYLMVTIQIETSNIQNIHRQSPNVY